MLARRRHPPADVARRFALALLCWVGVAQSGHLQQFIREWSVTGSAVVSVTDGWTDTPEPCKCAGRCTRLICKTDMHYRHAARHRAVLSLSQGQMN